MTARHVRRRAVAGNGLAALVLAAAAAGSAKAAELDGELLAHCAEFQAVEDEGNRIYEELADLLYPFRAAHPLAQRERECCARYCQLRDLITKQPAKTPEGIAAKARVLLADFAGEDDFENYPAAYDPRGALALSLARDILGRAS